MIRLRAANSFESVTYDDANRRPRLREIDWHKTIRANLKRYEEQQKLAADQAKLADAQQARAEEFQAEQMRQQMENQRTAAEIDARVEMNTADNVTAMRLAAAEIASGEKIAVSTGTGINPQP